MNQEPPKHVAEALPARQLLTMVNLIHKQRNLPDPCTKLVRTSACLSEETHIEGC